MQPDHASPTVAVAVTYDVGARNERPGQSGFAHLFEHMMFEGSKNVPKGEHFKLVSARGGTLNGTTSSDRTNYFEALPASELALGLWLEADRMKWLDVNSAYFENQRRVVEEEFRMSVENAAYMPALLELEARAFTGYFPYAHPAIGSMADLNAARFEWVRDFHAAFYAPNNAVLSVVGDFDPDTAVDLIRRYFDDANPQVRIPSFAPPPLAEQTAERRASVDDPHARTAGLYYGWVVPPIRTPEHYALELLALLLADGESSRLHQLIVRERELGRRVSASTDGHRGPDLFVLSCELTQKAELGAVERLLDAALQRLARTPPSAAELDKAKSRMRSRFLFGLESNLSRAIRFGEFETFFGDARLLGRELDAYRAVTSEDVRNAAARYLRKERRTVVEVLPAPSASKTKPPRP